MQFTCETADAHEFADLGGKYRSVPAPKKLRADQDVLGSEGYSFLLDYFEIHYLPTSTLNSVKRYIIT